MLALHVSYRTVIASTSRFSSLPSACLRFARSSSVICSTNLFSSSVSRLAVRSSVVRSLSLVSPRVTCLHTFGPSVASFLIVSSASVCRSFAQLLPVRQPFSTRFSSNRPNRLPVPSIARSAFYLNNHSSVFDSDWISVIPSLSPIDPHLCFLFRPNCTFHPNCTFQVNCTNSPSAVLVLVRTAYLTFLSCCRSRLHVHPRARHLQRELGSAGTTAVTLVGFEGITGSHLSASTVIAVFYASFNTGATLSPGFSWNLPGVFNGLPLFYSPDPTTSGQSQQLLPQASGLGNYALGIAHEQARPLIWSKAEILTSG
jgi:hypothetical protein